MEDIRLMFLLKEGNEKAFDCLYNKYYRLVYYQAFLIVKNQEDAEDITQSVFIKFYTSVSNLNVTINVKNYLSQMSRNLAIDVYRKKTKQEANIDAENLVDKSDQSPLIDFHGLLEEEENQILILRINFSYSFKEIASDLNKTVGYVQAKYYKALDKVKVYYLRGEQNGL